MEYNIQSLVKLNAERFGNDPYIYEKEGESFISHSHKEFFGDVCRLAGYLQSQGLTHKKIAIYARNSYEYMVADAAIMGFVGVCVTLSKAWGAYDVGNALGFLQVDALLYSQDKDDIVSVLKEQYPDILFIPIEKVCEVEE
ncbi:MAG: AMP-binding protein, partial [Clostridia bacterium]|nr:AMP-binding protein [Clostridia bacterium]